MDITLLNEIVAPQQAIWPAIIGLLGTLAATGASIAATNKTNKLNRDITNDTNRTNRDIAAGQTAANIRLWEMNNEYNSPANQFKRLTQAGLSNAAAAQSIAGVPAQAPQASSLGSAVAPPPMETPDLSPLFNGLNIIGMMREAEQLRKEKSEADITEQEADATPQFIFSKQQAMELANMRTRQLINQEADKHPYHMRALKWTAENARVENQRMKQDVKAMKLSYNRAKFDFSWAQHMKPLEFTKMFEEIRTEILNQGKIFAETGKAVAETHEAETQAGLNVANTGLAHAQTGLVNAQTDKTNAETKYISLQSYGQVIDNCFKRHGCPDSVALRVGSLAADGLISLDELESEMKGTCDYLDKGYENFNDPSTFEFLTNVFNEGDAKASQLGMHTLGSWIEIPKLFGHKANYKAKNKE